MSKLNEQDLPPEDLDDLSTPSRGAGLLGLISGSSPTPAAGDTAVRAPASAADSRTEPASAPATTAVTPAPPRRRSGPGRPRSRNVKTVSAIYVSPNVRQRFETYRHKNKKTNLQVVLDAIAARKGDLNEIINESRVSTAPVDPLFPADPSAVRYLGGGNVTIGFSPTPEQQVVLDRIGDDLGFDTRSTWIAPVLNAFLPGRKDL